MFFSILAKVLLLFAVLFVLGLLLPLSISLRCSAGGVFVWVKVFFIPIKVFPLKPKKQGPQKKPRAKKEKVPKEKPEEKTKPKKTPGQGAALIRRLIRASFAALLVFLRHMRIKGLRLVAPLHCQSAADTAILYGKAQALLGALYAFLSGRLRLQIKKVQLLPDYGAQMQKEWFFACKLVFNPVIMFKMAFVFLRIFLKRKGSVQHVKRRTSHKQTDGRDPRKNTPNGGF